MGQEASRQAAWPPLNQGLDESPFHIPMNGAPEQMAELTPDRRLGEAARHGQVEVVRKILSNHPDVDVNITGPTGWTPLMEAAIMGRTAVVYVLLEQPNIDPNRKSVDGLTALMMASWWGYAAVVHLLLRHPDTDINAQNEEGLTALMKITSSGSSNNLVPEQERMRERGHRVVIRLLLSCPNVDVNVQDKFGNTALFYAAKMGKTDMVEELLGHPVIDFRIRNKRGKTALDAAKRRTPIAEMLKEAARVREERVANVCRPVGAAAIAALMDEANKLGEDEICVICLSAPRQSGFVHAGTTHSIVCRACSKAIPVGSPCPLCRQLVEKIVDIPREQPEA
uniref:RING-type domain-containing protein n=1 Tax=Dunaliella tertiolecta TaxID=3047 RepID=A0A7S3VNP8_DUNTE